MYTLFKVPVLLQEFYSKIEEQEGILESEDEVTLSELNNRFDDLIEVHVSLIDTNEAIIEKLKSRVEDLKKKIDAKAKSLATFQNNLKNLVVKFGETSTTKKGDISYKYHSEKLGLDVALSPSRSLDSSNVDVDNEEIQNYVKTEITLKLADSTNAKELINSLKENLINESVELTTKKSVNAILLKKAIEENGSTIEEISNAYLRTNLNLRIK